MLRLSLALNVEEHAHTDKHNWCLCLQITAISLGSEAGIVSLRDVRSGGDRCRCEGQSWGSDVATARSDDECDRGAHHGSHGVTRYSGLHISNVQHSCVILRRPSWRQQMFYAFPWGCCSIFRIFVTVRHASVCGVSNTDLEGLVGW